MLKSSSQSETVYLPMKRCIFEIRFKITECYFHRKYKKFVTRSTCSSERSTRLFNSVQNIRSGVFPETLCLPSLMEHSSRARGKGNETIRI